MIRAISFFILPGILGLAGWMFRPGDHAAVDPPSRPECVCSNLDRQVVATYVEVSRKNRDGFAPVGAGTVIRHNGQLYVLTAGHVADVFNEYSKEDYDEEDLGSPGDKHSTHPFLRQVSEDCANLRVWESSVVASWFDDNHDLALLKPTNDEGLTAARYTGTTKLERGADAWYIGTPGGFNGFLEKTIINRPFFRATYTRAEDSFGANPDAMRVIVNGNGWYGNSGGGLFVLDDYSNYCLVGVVVELNRAGEKASIQCITQADINQFLKDFDNAESR